MRCEEVCAGKGKERTDYSRVIAEEHNKRRRCKFERMRNQEKTSQRLQKGVVVET